MAQSFIDILAKLSKSTLIEHTLETKDEKETVSASRQECNIERLE